MHPAAQRRCRLLPRRLDACGRIGCASQGRPAVFRVARSSRNPGPGGGVLTMVVDIVIPVYNEERDLEMSVRRLRRYLDQRFPFSAGITIADNGSTDQTLAIARRLALDLRGVRVIHLEQKGRGRAVRQAWLQSEAWVVAYMDVDLSTDLDALLPLVAPLVSGHSQVAIGSRLAPGAVVARSLKR